LITHGHHATLPIRQLLPKSDAIALAKREIRRANRNMPGRPRARRKAGMCRAGKGALTRPAGASSQ
jgi:hypothetical protein